MTVENFETIAKKIKDQGESFYLHVMGEPTSHPQFWQILEICQKYNMKVNITTNGTLLDKTGDDIINSDVHMVSVSLHSFEANNINADMRRYLDKIMLFCRKCLNSGTICELRLWNFDRQSVYDKNALNGQIIEYIQNSLDLEFDLAQAVEQNLIEGQKGNSRKYNFRLKDNIFLGMAEHFEWPGMEKPRLYEKGFCYGLRNQIAILAGGQVVPCCLDSEGNMELGNIYQNSLEEIVASDRAMTIYNGFTNGKATEVLCRTCGYMNKFAKKK